MNEEALYRQALVQNPRHFEARQNLGAVLYQRGRFEEAIAEWRLAAELRPGDAAIQHNLGAALRGLGRLDEAVAAYRVALGLKYDDAETHFNLATSLREQGNLDEAIAESQIAAGMGLIEAENTMGNALLDLGRVNEAMEGYERVLRKRPDHVRAQSNRLYAMHFQPDLSAEDIAKAHEEWGKSWDWPGAAYENNRDPERPLRIGLVSADFRGHSVAYFLLPLLRGRDRASYGITAYSTNLRADGMTAILRGLADGWEDISGMSNEAAAAKIRADRIDVLIDLGGHTAMNRLPIFAMRPAPVQATWLGYPDSTGLKAIQWRITDAVADPPGRQGLIYLPRTAWCFEPFWDAAEGERPEKQEVKFGCFNAMPKINGPLLRLWGRIMARVPGSRLMVKNRAMNSPESRRKLLADLTAQGVEASRVELLEPRPDPREHLACYRGVDIALDTFPYNGTTTTCEAMWMGVPVVTLAGDSHVSRVGASLLGGVGLGELVATSEDQYVELAADTPRLKGLGAMLRERMKSSSLMDAAGFARDMEEAWRRMWIAWISSR